MQLSDLNIEKRYYYANKLSKEEKRLYRFMVECILKRQYKFRYLCSRWNNPEQGDDYPVLLYDDPDEFVWTGLVYHSVCYDIPEFFFLAGSGLGYDTETNVYDIGKGEYTEEEIELLTNRLDEIYHEFDGVPTGFELEVAVSNYIVKSFDYEDDEDRLSDTEKSEIFTVAGLLKRGRGVCIGISRLAQYIFQRRGMDVALVATDPPGEEKGHAWLAVKIRGRYYHLDITSDETYSNDPECIQKRLFNVTDADMIKEQPHYDKSFYKGIECRSWRDNYYNRMGMYYRTHKEITEAVLKTLKENCHNPNEVYFCFKTPKRMSHKSTLPAIQKAINLSEQRVVIRHTGGGGYHILGITCKGSK